MAFNIFGFHFKKTKEDIKKDKLESFVLPQNNDGAVNVDSVAGAYGAYIDFDATVKNEFELITRYRELALLPDVDRAIDDIINELIVLDSNNPNTKSVDLNLENVPVSKGIKNKIIKEFDNILLLLDWKNQAYEIARNWYIDGRLYYHILLDPNNAKNGIIELRYIDPRQIRKIREIDSEIDPQTGLEIQKIKDEYFVFNQQGIIGYNNPQTFGNISTGTNNAKITTDSICYVNSGIVDQYSSTILSHLHKAIKPINQLKMMEDSSVIYRLARAPERRVFYVDIGNLPKAKADEYLRSVMLKYRNKMTYNIETGEVRDDRRYLSMLEDFFLPRREGGNATEITTLAGGANLGEIEDIVYFQKKVYNALNVPISRLNNEASFNLGRSTEITRDEVKFAKFIDRLRTKFSQLFVNLLRVQLIAKNIVAEDEWNNDIEQNLNFVYNSDNYFSELKEAEILRNRMDLLSQFDSYSEKYYSVDWIKRNILKQSDEDIKEIDTGIEAEEGIYTPPPQPGDEPNDGIHNLIHSSNDENEDMYTSEEEDELYDELSDDNGKFQGIKPPTKFPTVKVQKDVDTSDLKGDDNE